MRTIHSLLVANRGEIARRIFRTCRTMGIRTVAVHSDADAGAAFVREADVAVAIGPGPAAASYLRGAAVIEAAVRTGADAIHPGYGFLSENADFAEQVIAAGLLWVGPPPSAIRAMGDKAASRRTVVAHGVPVVPGYDGDDQQDVTFLAEGARIGVPLLVKASAGGGGRGMRRVDALDALPDALASARREAEAAFGDGRLLLERYVLRPRHIEVQILADAHGKVLHLGERECSVQRRHQKVLEEAPSPGVDADLREELGEAAVRVARAVSYVGAGTVEFVMGADGSFCFLEMNTRLQVEHPVTEAVTGLDLVAAQLRIAEGRPLDEEQDDIGIFGHAIEARVCAEDPTRDWMPASGKLVRANWGEHEAVRVDSGFESGDEVPSHYDSMLAKVVAWGPDRAEANRRLRRALEAAWVPGIVTNLPLLRDVVAHPSWESAALHTGFFGEHGLPRPVPSNLARGAVVAAAWSAWQRQTAAHGGAFRLWGAATETDIYAYGSEQIEVRTTAVDDAFDVATPGGTRRVKVLSQAGDSVRLVIDGVTRSVLIARAHGTGPLNDGDTLYVHLGDAEAAVTLVPRFPAPARADDAPGACVAPTPGVVRVVHVQEGAAVEAGAPLVTLEAMKVEHHLAAREAGTVTAVRCAVGDAVEAGTLLVRVEPASHGD